MRLPGNSFQPAPEPPRLSIRRLVFYCLAILAGLILLRLLDTGVVRSPFAPPGTPTRSGYSYATEGDAFFDAGNLDKAVQAYRNATQVDPKNPEFRAELARIQTYSSALMLSSEEQAARLEEARASIAESLALDPEYGMGYAIQALVLDWSADANLVGEETREDYLAQAYQSSIRAQQLLPDDPLALAFQAEVLVDQANWAQALDVGARAVQLAPGNLDVRRAYAYVLESNGYYERAIEQYQIAIQINNNLPFLHMRLGANYRKIGETTADPLKAKEMIEWALEEFSRAADLNPGDPLPYLSIANTYANQGEFFIAERNAWKALALDNTNPLIYGRLGAIYYKAKNYEGAQKVLQCAVRGCRAAENEEEGVDVTGIALAPSTLDFYYYFGSVSAFFGDCEEAARVFAELRASPWNDAVIEEIIQEGERICAALTQTAPTP